MPQAQQENVISTSRVVITGAARGMGALYARMAAREGARSIVLWDVDQEGANELAAELKSAHTDVCVVSEDLSTLEGVAAGAARIKEFMGEADVLINNAGIVRGAPFWEHDPVKDIELTMRINTLAPMWLTRELLPAMIADSSRPKRILNVASAAGTLANLNMSVYASSKWALLGWSDSTRLELTKHGHAHVAVTTFCPSYVSTGMFAGARGPLLTPIMTPQDAAQAAWDGMVAGKPLVTKPWTVKLSMALRGILPVRIWDVVADRVFKVYSSMDKFTGRS